MDIEMSETNKKRFKSALFKYLKNLGYLKTRKEFENISEMDYATLMRFLVNELDKEGKYKDGKIVGVVKSTEFYELIEKIFNKDYDSIEEMKKKLLDAPFSKTFDVISNKELDGSWKVSDVVQKNTIGRKVSDMSEAVLIQEIRKSKDPEFFKNLIKNELSEEVLNELYIRISSELKKKNKVAQVLKSKEFVDGFVAQKNIPPLTLLALMTMKKGGTEYATFEAAEKIIKYKKNTTTLDRTLFALSHDPDAQLKFIKKHVKDFLDEGLGYVMSQQLLKIPGTAEYFIKLQKEYEELGKLFMTTQIWNYIDDRLRGSDDYRWIRDYIVYKKEMGIDEKCFACDYYFTRLDTDELTKALDGLGDEYADLLVRMYEKTGNPGFLPDSLKELLMI